jgi:hypothetical protein
MGRVAVHPSLGVGQAMVARRVLMPARDVVFFKGIIEASDGLAAVFAERGGDLVVAAPAERTEELDRVLAELCAEIGAMRVGE